MRRTVGVMLGLLVSTAMTAPTDAAPLSDQVIVTVDPTMIEVTLGGSIDVSVDVANGSTSELQNLVVHIDITALDVEGSVDPEDWTSTLSKHIGTVEAGQTVSVDWRIQPISPGTFSLYAVALTPDDDSVAASNILRVTVSDRRGLNPNGVLPVVVGTPVLVGGLLVIRIRRARRGRSRRHDE